jgi:hypothetical protein
MKNVHFVAPSSTINQKAGKFQKYQLLIANKGSITIKTEISTDSVGVTKR